MSKLFDEASLAMIPSAYKDGKLYSIRPTDGDGDFTFSRGSNLAATRVDVNGLIEKGRENVLRNSNAPNTHLINLSTYSGSQSDPFGGNTAWAWRETATTGQHYGVTQSDYSLGVGIWTFSVYVKPVNKTSIYFTWNSPNAGNYGNATFDFTTKAFTSGNRIADGYEELSGGWFRLYFAINVTSAGTWNVYYNTLGSYTGNASNGYDFTRFQIERGLVATDYIETTSTTAQAGILEDMPRLDYSGGASCPALLLEPQRTNEVPNSEYFSTWSLVNIGTASLPVVTSNYATSPDGSQNATRIQFDLNGGTTSSDRSIIRQLLTTATGRYFSVWMKSATGTDQKILWHSNGDANETTITNEWQRFEYDRNSESIAWAGLSLRGATSSVDTADILVWGFQCESGSYPTSYIPTYGTSVTRSVDSCLATSVSDLIGQTQGTMFFEIDQPYADGVNGAWSISDGSSSNRVTMNTLDVNSSTFTLSIATNYAGGSTNVISTNTTYGLHKVAIQYTDTTLKIFVDGAEATSGSTDGFGNYTNFYIGANQAGTGNEIREFKQAVLFPTALTDSECIALTTL